ncbi:MAG: DUF354 domain-containing protein [Bacteroidales bacterium]|nr:DUF354 domain-containing protein [Bacteroidales bacterium]
MFFDFVSENNRRTIEEQSENRAFWDAAWGCRGLPVQWVGMEDWRVSNFLIDIGHPGHVHLFRHLAAELRRRGHTLLYSVRDIPVAKRLMECFGMTPYLDLGAKRDSRAGKALAVLRQDAALLRFVVANRIECGISSGISLGHVSQLTGMTALMFDDDDDAAEPLVVRYGHPASRAVFTPDCIVRGTRRAVYYHSTHELAYLHPDLFRPDAGVAAAAGLAPGERYFIMRFVAMKGHHDVGEQGLAKEQKLALLRLLCRHGRVIITGERELDAEFEPYRLPVPPEQMHSLMAGCSLFVGDSQTMTSEAAVLGVPALKCNSFAGRLSVPNMLEERFRLCHAYTPSRFGDMLSEAGRLLSMPAVELRGEWQRRREAMLRELVNPVPWLADYIEENYGFHT